jgi:hypothetical protein
MSHARAVPPRGDWPEPEPATAAGLHGGRLLGRAPDLGRPASSRVGNAVGVDELDAALATMQRLIAVLDADGG